MSHVQFCAMIVFTAGLLAACMPEQTTSDRVDKRPECAGAAFDELIGQPADAALVIPAPKRVVAKNAPVTADHNPLRSNVWLDKNGLIDSISCG